MYSLVLTPRAPMLTFKALIKLNHFNPPPHLKLHVSRYIYLRAGNVFYNNYDPL